MGKVILIIFIIILGLVAIYFHLKVEERNPSRQEIIECEAKELIEEAYCFTELAVEKQNYVICKKINETSLRDNCFVLVAVAAEKKIICNRILERDTANMCFLLVSKKNKTKEDESGKIKRIEEPEGTETTTPSPTASPNQSPDENEPSEESSGSIGDCNWACKSWSSCSNNIQLRDCTYVGSCQRNEAQQARSCE